jgi:hypothetical protein
LSPVTEQSTFVPNPSRGTPKPLTVENRDDLQVAAEDQTPLTIKHFLRPASGPPGRSAAAAFFSATLTAASL